MSDYLWDKTGARDAEVERLEALLGELRHRPRPLELPSEAEATSAQVGAHAFPARRRFRTAGFAVAAMLLLAFVALALVLLRGNATGDDKQSASQASRENSPGSQPQNIARQAITPTPQDEAKVAREPEKRVGQVVVNNVAQGSRKERQLAFVAKRQQARLPRVATASGSDNGVTRALQPSGFDGVALKTRLAAKEQLVYALRLTSSKLREVREKTQGAGDAKQSFGEGNRIKFGEQPR